MDLEVFNRLSYRQIHVFIKLFKERDVAKIDRLRQWYLASAKHFEETFAFLAALNLIFANGEWCAPTRELKEAASKLSETETAQEELRQFILVRLFQLKTAYLEEIYAYLSHFSDSGKECILKPSFEINYKFSFVRNFLIDMQLVAFDDNKYVLRGEILHTYLSSKESFDKLTQRQLEKLLEKKKDIGEAAEVAVLRHEKERFRNAPELLSKIKRVSVEDAKAGFDISSFDNEVNRKEIKIEVKAISRGEYTFVWSANEIKIAKRNPDNYYLYLLPVINGGKFDFVNMKIISNPYKKIYEEPRWVKEPLEYICKEVVF